VSAERVCYLQSGSECVVGTSFLPPLSAGSPPTCSRASTFSLSTPVAPTYFPFRSFRKDFFKALSISRFCSRSRICRRRSYSRFPLASPSRTFA